MKYEGSARRVEVQERRHHVAKNDDMRSQRTVGPKVKMQGGGRGGGGEGGGEEHADQSGQDRSSGEGFSILPNTRSLRQIFDIGGKGEELVHIVSS